MGFSFSSFVSNSHGRRNPEEIPWGQLEVDYVMECSGVFKKIKACERHIMGGCRKVIISAPSNDAPMFVCGVNEKEYKTSMTGKLEIEAQSHLVLSVIVIVGHFGFACLSVFS